MFKQARSTPRRRSERPRELTGTAAPLCTPQSTPPPLKLSERDICEMFQKQKIKKAPDPDGVLPSCLNACAEQLAQTFTSILNQSLELCDVFSCFKNSNIIEVPKKNSITALNDYRPFALIHMGS